MSPLGRDPNMKRPTPFGGPVAKVAEKRTNLHGIARAVVESASTGELALAAVSPSPFVDLLGWRGYVPCPRCQRRSVALTLHAPGARPHALGLFCELCGTTTTRAALEAAVLGDPSAIVRLVEMQEPLTGHAE